MLTFRDASESDYPLLADSFWKVARSVPSCYGAGRLFLVGMLEKVIRDPSWNITILCDDTAPDETIGWCIWRSADEVFWLTVKPRYQHLGMAREILKHIGATPDRVIHAPILPPAVVVKARKHGYVLVQRPYMAIV